MGIVVKHVRKAQYIEIKNVSVNAKKMNYIMDKNAFVRWDTLKSTETVANVLHKQYITNCLVVVNV